MGTPEHELIVSARELARQELAPGAADRDRTGEFPLKQLRQLGRAGLLAVTVPQNLGGRGASYRVLSTVIEEVSRADASIGVLASTQHSLVAMPLARHGTPDQIDRFLAPLLRGDHIGAVSITESQSGTNAADIRTRAEFSNGRYRINGAKQLVTAGAFADLILLLAATDPDAGARGLTCFLVPTSTPGLRVGRVEEKLGLTSTGTAELILEEVEVDESAVLGGVNQGYKLLMDALAVSRLGIAAQAVGIAQAALDAALAYADERHSFGKPIKRHQAVGFRMADMATEIEAARSLVLATADRIDHGLPYEQQSSMAKLFAGEMVERVTSQALQIFGGQGYLRTHPVERLYREARVCQIYEGTSDAQRMIIVRSLNAAGPSSDG